MKYFSLGKKEAQTLKEESAFLKILSDENRLKIIFILKKNEQCVCEIVNCLGLPQNLVSHHLKVLRKEEIVSSTKNGLRVTYFLNKKKLTHKINSFNLLILG